MTSQEFRVGAVVSQVSVSIFFVCVSHDLTSSVCQPTSVGLVESVHMTKSASQGTRDEVVEMHCSLGHDGCIGSCVSLV